MALVLEGPDNSGKSTLANKLHQLMGWEIVHSGGPGNPDDYEDRLLEDIWNMQRNVIMDRSFIISDSVYSPLCRGKALFDPRPWFRKIQALTQHDESFMLLFCIGDTETMMDLGDHQVKEHETEEHVAEVHKRQQDIIWYYRNLAGAFDLFTECSIIDPRLLDDQAIRDIAAALK